MIHTLHDALSFALAALLLPCLGLALFDKPLALVIWALTVPLLVLAHKRSEA